MAVLLLCALVSCTPAGDPPAAEYLVQAYRGWQGTGIQVDAGDVITTRAHGRWWYTPGEFHGPEGHASYKSPSFYPVPGVPGGVLLARVGDNGSPVVVGRSKRFRTGSSGELFFRIDDDYLDDNEGYVTVEVRVSP